MSQKKHSVKVTIGGEDFQLRSDRSEEHTRAVAEHVDRALREVQSSGAIVENHKAAILAALAITDELFQSRLSAREMEQRLHAVTENLSRYLPPKKRPSRVSGAFASSEDDS